MSWLSRLAASRKAKEPPKSTTIILHRDDTSQPIIHNLQGLWTDEALLGVLDALLQEHLCDQLCTTCEVLWQDGAKAWGLELDLVLADATD